MLKVLDAINLTEKHLAKKGIESARLNAELLLADVLKCRRLDLYLKFDSPLTESEIIQYRLYLARRSKHEPLQYILGKTEFYGLSIKVNSDVLIPRPETEQLVESILNSLNNTEEEITILDIGTGSGNISIALAKNNNRVKITAVDVSEKALKIAQSNADTHGVSERIKFITMDIMSDNIFSLSHKFNIIVSNPPYVEKEQYSKLQEEIVKYEPEIAVTDNANGLKFYERIIEAGNNLLNHNGKIFFELGAGKSGSVQKFFLNSGYKNIVIEKDYSKIDRIICGVKK